MNKKKIFYNAPAPLFVEALLGEERDVGFSQILSVSAADHHRRTGADIAQCRNDLEAKGLPDDAIPRGEMLKEKYRGFPYFSLERQIFISFQNEYHSDEERVLRLAYLAISSSVGNKPYAKLSNERLLALMSGNKNPGPPLQKLISEYRSIYKMRKLRNLLTQYFKVSFYTRTRGFSVSLTLSEEELAEMVGKPNNPQEHSKQSSDIQHYLNIISEKEAEIANLRLKVEELTRKLQEKGSKKKKRNPFSTETNKAAKEIFCNFYALKVPGASYYWEAKDAGQLSEILKHLKFAREEKGLGCSEKEIIDSFKVFLDTITDSWVLSHLSVSTIASKFNELIASARSNYGKKKHPADIDFKGDNQGAFDNEDLTGWG